MDDATEPTNPRAETKADAEPATGTGQAHDGNVGVAPTARPASVAATPQDPTIRLTDYVAAAIGTSLSPRLLAAAERAADAAARAANDRSADPNEQLEQSIAAILAAHAAVEAEMNEVGDRLDSAWWAQQEHLKFERKFGALVKRLRSTKRGAGATPRGAVRRLNTDRNRVAHFRGVPQGGGLAVSGPAVAHRGDISPVRAYFDAARARSAVDAARAAIDALI